MPLIETRGLVFNELDSKTESYGNRLICFSFAFQAQSGLLQDDEFKQGQKILSLRKGASANDWSLFLVSDVFICPTADKPPSKTKEKRTEKKKKRETKGSERIILRKFLKEIEEEEEENRRKEKQMQRK